MSRSTRPLCVIAGTSHTWALGFPKAHPEGIYGIVPHPDDERFAGLASPWPRDAQYWKELVSLSKAHPIALSFRGNQSFGDFMFAPAQAFDFAVASRPDLPVDETVPLVPELMVRQHFESSLTELAELLTEMRALGGPGVILLGTPPPREHGERQRSLLLDEPYFVELATTLGVDLETIPLTSELLHLKMWQVIQDMMRTLADAHGVPFLASPSDATTAMGFLREELGAEHDMRHANRTYGALVLRDLAAMVVPALTR